MHVPLLDIGTCIRLTIVCYNLTFEFSKISKYMYGWKWKGMPYFHSQNEMLVGFFKIQPNTADNVLL